MAVVEGVYVDWSKSPRIVWVPEPLTTISIQDLYDTCRDIEDEPGALQYESLISAGGKEDLGGGSQVGVTATMLNAVVAFEARQTEASQGTVTTSDPDGRTLIDSAATFIADGVVAGSFIVNETDGSACTVLTVVSETELVTDVLDGGTDNQFTFGDGYEVFNTTQCEISGGNLVAVDGLGSPINPVLPTFGVQVIRSLSSSATITNLTIIEATQVFLEALLRNGFRLNPTTGKAEVWSDDGLTKLYEADIFHDYDATQPYDGTGGGVERRERFETP